MWTKQFWKGVAERAFWQFAATLLALFGADGFNLFHADWKAVLAAAALSTLISILKSIVIGASGIGPAGSASAVHDRPTDPA